MIPTRNWDILINRLRAGDTILEACIVAQMTKMTLYRRLKIDYNFKTIFDEAIFHANSKIDTSKGVDQERKMEDLKKIVLKRRR